MKEGYPRARRGRAVEARALGVHEHEGPRAGAGRRVPRVAPQGLREHGGGHPEPLARNRLRTRIAIAIFRTISQIKLRDR